MNLLSLILIISVVYWAYWTVKTGHPLFHILGNNNIIALYPEVFLRSPMITYRLSLFTMHQSSLTYRATSCRAECTVSGRCPTVQCTPLPLYRSWQAAILISRISARSLATGAGLISTTPQPSSFGRFVLSNPTNQNGKFSSDYWG